MGMISRIKARRAKRAGKTEGNLALGGSKANEAKILADASYNSSRSRELSTEGRKDLKQELDDSRASTGRARKEYAGVSQKARDAAATRDTSIGDINAAADEGTARLGGAGDAAARELTSGASAGIDARNNALATGSLVGSTDNALSQRRSTLAGSPTLGQATETAISANAQNAAAQQARAGQMIQRQAMGLAASQGEGGALAMQQALASAGAGAADMAGQTNLALADQNAQLRHAAATGQRQEDVDLANSDVTARLGANQAERSAQLGIADKNAASLEGAAAARAGLGMDVASAQAAARYQGALATTDARAAAAGQDAARQDAASQRELGYSQQAAGLAGGQAELANAKLASDQSYQGDLLTARLASGQAQESNKERSLAKKIFMPFGILGN